MADTGSPFFIPYIEPTDLVRDYPAANEAMALAIVAALEDIPVTIKKVDAFTGSGTFVVPAGVTYAIAHMQGGGGGIGASGSGANGGNSSVAFATGTVIGRGGAKMTGTGALQRRTAGPANSGQSASAAREDSASASAMSGSSTTSYAVAGADVTPGASIAVVVGAGGAAGTGGAAGGSGYVYIEYHEEA